MAFFLGTLILTGLLSAFFVWMPGRYIDQVIVRALVANVLALVASSVVAGYGWADGGPPKFEVAFTSYLLPQIVWTVVWLLILRARKSSKVAKSEPHAPNPFHSSGGADS
jgi:hypothetical protein